MTSGMICSISGDPQTDGQSANAVGSVLDPSPWRLFQIVYGAAHFGKSLIWYSSELLFAFFLTERCGLSPWRMAHVLAGSLLFSSLVDVAAGAGLARGLRSVAGAGKMQWPAALISGATLLAFAATPLIGPDHRLVFAVVSSLAFRLTYTFYDIPQNAILSLAGQDAADRLRLAAIRLVLSNAASLTVTVAAAPVLIGEQGVNRFLLYAALIAGIAILSALGLRILSMRYRPRAAPAPAPGGAEARPLRRLAALLVLLCIVAGTSAVFSKLEPYFAAWMLSDTVTRSWVLFFIGLGGALSNPACIWIAGRFSRGTAFRMFAVLMATGAALFLVAGAIGPVMAAVSGMILGAGGGGLAMLLWAAVADAVADRDPAAATVLSPALAFGIVTGCIKLSLALAVIAVSQVLTIHADQGVMPSGNSVAFVAPMAGAPLIGALLCLMLAPILNRRRAGRHSGARELWK